MVEIVVEGMTCGHCVRAVDKALMALPGVTAVSIDLASGYVRIDGDPDMTAVGRAIEEEGYTVKPTA